MRFLNYYVHCATEWTDEWDCMCNDQCPKCHTNDIEPYQSQEINDDGTHGEIIRHVPVHWVPEQGWPGQTHRATNRNARGRNSKTLMR